MAFILCCSLANSLRMPNYNGFYSLHFVYVDQVVSFLVYIETSKSEEDAASLENNSK